MELARLHQEVARLHESIARQDHEINRLSGENIRAQEEMGRLRQALAEERVSRRADVSSLWDSMEKEAGRRAAQMKTASVQRTTGKVTTDAAVQTNCKASSDVTEQEDSQTSSEVTLTIDVFDKTCPGLTNFDLGAFLSSEEFLDAFVEILSGASSLRELTLPAGFTERQLETLLKPLLKLERLSIRVTSKFSGRWLLKLPVSLKMLDITGPYVTSQLTTIGQPNARGLSVAVRGVDDNLLTQLAGPLAPRATELITYDCPRVTADGIHQFLSALDGLQSSILSAALTGVVTDAALTSLHDCRHLENLQLGDPQLEYTYLPADRISSLVVTCQKLRELKLFTATKNAQSIMDALLRAQRDLTSGTNNKPRTVHIYVSEPVYRSLRKPLADSNIKLMSTM